MTFIRVAARGVVRPLLAGAFVVTLAPCGGRKVLSRPDHGPPPAATSPVPSAPARAPGGAVEVAMTIRCKAPTHRINPLVYGIGVQPMRDLPDQWRLGATARRWGGNHTSRYNWELGNAWNTGKDWFFKNVDYDRRPGPAHQRFIEDGLAHGVPTVLTVPMLGWVARDTTSYSFPVSVFGPQATTAPESSDAGNGVTRKGGLVVPGPPERTSVRMRPVDIGRWVRALRERREAGRSRDAPTYILDNEPTLWSETHRDVHPEPVSYDELLDKTVAYATEIRRADPEALIAGPALWGWTAYFYSGVDKAAYPAHPDQDRHGGVPLLPWWLGEVASHESRAGIRLIDLVDVHFYPQGRGLGVGSAGETDLDTAARRIRSTRALWDPTYQDESWIANKVALIPRLKTWIAEKHPGLGVSIGEYNFGAEAHMSGGLAVAEALGRFGEQGLTSAFYWDYPANDTPASWAFRAYRNFDGRGGRFLDESVPAESRDPVASIFASRDASGEHLVVVLLDLDPAAPVQARIDSTSCGRVARRAGFVYVAGAPGFAELAPEQDAAGTSPHVTLPPYSITVLDLHFAPEP